LVNREILEAFSILDFYGTPLHVSLKIAYVKVALKVVARDRFELPFATS
jgi:hypothetical protein